MKKRLSYLLLGLVLVLVSSMAFADDSALLGKGQGGVKVDYIRFSDSDLKNFNVDSGPYVALEAYCKVKNASRFYLGSEIGYSKVDGSITDTSTGTAIKVSSDFKYIPVELNAKWLFDLGSKMNFAVGTGVSLNYVDVEASASAAGLTIFDSDHDWIFGWQGFFDLNYSLGRVFVGLDGKYKQTQEFNGIGEKFSNFTAGAHVGWTY
jgi:hypothetical protein